MVAMLTTGRAGSAWRTAERTGSMTFAAVTAVLSTTASEEVGDCANGR